MYWDSEMFKRKTKTRKALEEGKHEKKDYKKLALEIVKNPEQYATDPHKIGVINDYKKLIIKQCGQFDEKIWEQIYTSLVVGDPKKRTLRAITVAIGTKRRNNKE